MRREELIADIYLAMFESYYPDNTWATDYPLEVVLYGLIEAKDKLRRTPGMSHTSVFKYASTIMERRDREQIKKARREAVTA